MDTTATLVSRYEKRCIQQLGGEKRLYSADAGVGRLFAGPVTDQNIQFGMARVCRLGDQVAKQIGGYRTPRLGRRAEGRGIP